MAAAIPDTREAGGTPALPPQRYASLPREPEDRSGSRSPSSLRGRSLRVRKGLGPMFKPASLAGIFGLASLAATAQQLPLSLARGLDPVVVTASRGLSAHPTLRDATVITREDLDGAGALSLAEVLERFAGIELRATGGPGQPQGLFIRGAGTAQTLVLVDGMRVGSATVGTTSIENIPLELIERIEVVKGPLSSLWGSEAMGGVVQVFTRGKAVPHLFVSTAYGSDNDRRVAAGLTTIDGGTAAVLTVGYRDVDAPSATTERAPFCHDPDRDPHDNAFANVRVSQRLWQGETVALEAFASRGRTHFDGCGADDRNEQSIGGARVTSSAHFPIASRRARTRARGSTRSRCTAAARWSWARRSCAARCSRRRPRSRATSAGPTRPSSASPRRAAPNASRRAGATMTTTHSASATRVPWATASRPPATASRRPSRAASARPLSSTSMAQRP